MKHGPIALIDEKLPVVAIAPHDAVFEKMLGNIQEVKARGGIGHRGHDRRATTRSTTILDPLLDSHDLAAARRRRCSRRSSTVIPLQLLAYHVAVRRGCDVDQPRNLAKSVTVE